MLGRRGSADRRDMFDKETFYEKCRFVNAFLEVFVLSVITNAIVLHLLSIRSRKEPLRSLHLKVLFGESMLPFEGRPRRPSLSRSHRRTV
jgi:hypothetical protein